MPQKVFMIIFITLCGLARTCQYQPLAADLQEEQLEVGFLALRIENKRGIIIITEK